MVEQIRSSAASPYGVNCEAGMGQDEAQKGWATKPPQSVLISANSFWNIANFRAELVEALASRSHRMWIAAPDGDEDWARARGVETIEIAIDRSGLNPATDAVLLFEYWRLFRRLRPAVFMGFTAKPNVYGSLAARLTGVTSLPNVSGLGTAFINNGVLSRLVGLLYRIAFRGCPIVFFQNPDDRDLFVGRKIVRPGQVRLLPGSGVNLDWFAPVPPSDEGQPRFLFIGRLIGDKGVRDFVAAAQLLKSEFPGWRFQMLGSLDQGNRSGIGPQELCSWVERGLIEHLGQADDVRPHIAAASAVVLPSYREGLPRSLLEAAAMARPLIASDVPGNREIVEHGVNGLMCEVRNPQSLAEAMRELATMGSERRAEMGRAGRAVVERSYGVEQVVDAYLKALAQLPSVTRV
jgi:glycosyltransferase involved in cell wall biosynthesis